MFLKIISILVGVFVFFQVIPYGDKTNPVVDKKLEIKASKEVMTILRRSCYDCHSNETKWPWYSYVAPISWSVYDHVEQGRRAVNFSIWQSYSQEQKMKIKKGTYRTVKYVMPLSQYTFIHSDAKMSKKDIKDMQNWASDGKGFMQINIR